mmetsp:Transcript_9944/g.16509  ORF Transcript_9944/g.16509 Transcript_9944/m.16509 type:complete len:174 (-) Transcript_9944:375-896(-)
MQASEEQKLYEIDNEVALTDFEDYAATYEEEVAAEVAFQANENARTNQPVQEDIPGAPSGWKKPCHPPDWKEPKARTAAGEPDEFATIDNPGGWSQYTYRPKFEVKKNGKYQRYCLPTGAMPVPADLSGKRSIGGYDFHYTGWTRPEDIPVYRSGTTRDTPFPDNRKTRTKKI